jgi:hypothetical protein
LRALEDHLRQYFTDGSGFALSSAVNEAAGHARRLFHCNSLNLDQYRRR